jgi:gliding motility-associated-like protein
VIWEYDFGDGTTEDIANPFHVFPDAGEYEVLHTVTNMFGCTDTLTRIITIDPVPMLFVPNAFTPDNDGINDIWGAYTYGFEVEAFEMLVFNRNGELVFRGTQPEQWWNGSHQQGTHYVQNGVYAWRCKYLSAHDGEQHVQTGHVTVVR